MPADTPENTNCHKGEPVCEGASFVLESWSYISSAPIVIFADEIDSAQKNSLIGREARSGRVGEEEKAWAERENHVRPTVTLTQFKDYLFLLRTRKLINSLGF